MAVATIFHQEKGVCTLQNVSFSLRKKKKVTIFRVPVHRTRWPFCSVAEQHANTQSAICEADTLVIRYSSTLVMVWVSWFSYPLQHGKNGKYEFILFGVFSLSRFFCILKYPSPSCDSFVILKMVHTWKTQHYVCDLNEMLLEVAYSCVPFYVLTA